MDHNTRSHKLRVTHPQRPVGDVWVDDNGMIGMGSPVVERFLGRPMADLFRWLESLGPGLQVEEV